MGGLRRCAAMLFVAWAGVASASAAIGPACKGNDLSIDPTIKPHYEDFADELVNGDGLFWTIEKAGVAPSYLYGTMHSTQSQPLAMAKEAAKYLEHAKVVATELGGPMDASAKVDMSSALLNAALSPGVDTLAGRFSEADATMADAYLSAHGYPTEFAHHLKLWFLAVAASLPACETEGEALGLPEVDDTIARLGAARGLPVVGLETIQEQVAALAAVSPELAGRMLLAAARSPDLDDDAYMTLLQLYQRKRPADAIAVLDAAPGVPDQDRAAERDFTRLLLVSRNATMAERALPYVKKGGAFIAVGALHLSGKDGLVERFRQAGYKVTKIW